MIDSRPIAVPDNYEPTDSRALDMPHVVAQWVQNIGGGIGAGMALAAVLWLADIDLQAAWRWPVGIAAIVAGASTMVRAYLDEYRSERRWNKREREHSNEMAVLVELCDRLEAERDALRSERDALARENARLESENSSLNYEWRKARATPRMVHMEDLVESEARRHARMLVGVWAEKGKRPSRSDMVPGTLTRTQWDAAYTELGRAQLLDGATRTEAEMLHALSTKWAEPVAVVGQ
jgi:hypothetical protein